MDRSCDGRYDSVAKAAIRVVFTELFHTKTEKEEIIVLQYKKKIC